MKARRLVSRMLGLASWASAGGVALSVALGVALGCASPRSSRLPAIPPPAPILADAPDTPDTAEKECAQVVADLKRYGECGLLDEDRRWWMGKWSELVEIDLALVKNPKLDEASRNEIAVSCRKAAQAVGWAATQCSAEAATRESTGTEPPPPPSPP
jgi:hypothetical protein